MKSTLEVSQHRGTEIVLPDMKKIWRVGLPIGLLLWALGLGLWWQQGFDRTLLWFFNPARVQQHPIIDVAQWLTAYGMAAITTIFVVYFILSKLIKKLDAPLFIYWYTICSLGLSGIAGDIIKELLARPRPVQQFGSEILVLSQSLTPSIPSGHSVKSVALVLPFLFLVLHQNKVHLGMKVLVSLLAAGVCFSRIVLGAHFASDVVAGVGMALVGLPFSMLFANMILKQTQAEQLPNLAWLWTVLLVVLTAIFMNM